MQHVVWLANLGPVRGIDDMVHQPKSHDSWNEGMLEVPNGQVHEHHLLKVQDPKSTCANQVGAAVDVLTQLKLG